MSGGVSRAWFAHLNLLPASARRLKQPVFLSIDLPFLSADATGVSSEMSGRWLLLIEKLVIQKLDQDCQSEDEGTEDDLPERAKKISLDGEMVGR